MSVVVWLYLLSVYLFFEMPIFEPLLRCKTFSPVIIGLIAMNCEHCAAWQATNWQQICKNLRNLTAVFFPFATAKLINFPEKNTMAQLFFTAGANDNRCGGKHLPTDFAL